MTSLIENLRQEVHVNHPVVDEIDITDRRRAEEALHESQNRYALATTAGRVGVWDWNLETGEIYVDPLLKTLLGFQDHELANHIDEWNGRVHPDDLDEVKRHARTHIDGWSPSYEVEHRMVHKDGSVRWFLTRAAIIPRGHGKAVRVMGTHTDVTERKRAELDAQRALAETAHVTRVAAMGELATSLAHEINQPLMAIMMNAQAAIQMLSTPDADLEEVREALADIVRSDRRASDVIHHMRGLLKKSEWERSIVDVNDIVTSVTRLLESEARLHRVSVALDLASGPLPVVADPIQVQQVVLNLLRNAIEASSDGTAAGSVTVSTAKVQRDEIELEVCDSGCGIDPVNMSRIFEPFFTTKGDGLGMGLAISRSIINAHGGRLMAVNNADRGATFRCALPEARQANVSDPGHAYVSGGRSV